MPTFNVELNSKPGKDGRYSVMLRITHNRKHKRISTGRYIAKKDFNKEAKYGNWIRTSDSDHKSVNDKIKKEIRLAEKRFDEAPDEEVAFSTTNIVAASDFFSYSELHIARLYSMGKYRTAEKRKHIINKIKRYHHESSLSFKQITTSFLRDYEAHLLSIGNHINTIYTDLKGFKAIINQAIGEGYLVAANNPFLNYRLKTVKVVRERLNQKELLKIEGLKLGQGTPLWHIRNYFFFSYFCAGIRFGDFVKLKWRNIEDGRLIYQMDKTAGSFGSFKSIPIPKKGLQILEYYKSLTTNPDHYIFPLFNDELDYSDIGFLKRQISSKNALVNKYLKKLSEEAEITKKVSFHVSRHSFADFARKKSKDMYGLSKTLGHSNIQPSQQYLDDFDQDAVDEIMKNVFED